MKAFHLEQQWSGFLPAMLDNWWGAVQESQEEHSLGMNGTVNLKGGANKGFHLITLLMVGSYLEMMPHESLTFLTSREVRH